jgi:hypothetical protein
MSALEEFVERIHQTDAMQELVRSLDEEPARFLIRVCRRYEETGRPVPDHYLQMTGYFGETMLRVLVQARLLSRHTGGRGSIYAYEPTADGLELHRRMREEGSE